MQATEKKSWVDQLEVTGPIKGIMAFIDELANTYDRRVAAMHADYQRDVEEILACYKKERQDFHGILEQQKNTIVELQTELTTLQQNYKHLNVEYNLTKDSLEINKQELAELSMALKTEQELIELTNQKIATVRQQLANSCMPGETIVATIPENLLAETVDVLQTGSADMQGKKPRLRFSRAKEFFRQVVADRLTRPIILKHKEQKPVVTVVKDEEDQDIFSY